MSEKRPSKAWKDLESHCAAVLGGKRVTVPWDLFQKRTDVIVADFPRLKVDCKRRKKSAINSLLSECKCRYCQPSDTPLIVTATHGDKQNAVASLPLSALADLLNAVRVLRDTRRVIGAKLGNARKLLAEAESKSALHPDWDSEAAKLKAVVSCLETLKEIARPVAGKEES